ncbi:hsp70 nucleotide exchange factor fes1 [Actinomortierella ambigua]|uniref:Hsp70 nucleotide exchange factor fes1 n=1 Tax=Actinomortierella ambigua TaxID=1343610 RepID=A0A9P6Q4E7_9FUNG|nr:hsp70 nucleotide exchange factor fes1 [Actinomortierella ambigua]
MAQQKQLNELLKWSINKATESEDAKPIPGERPDLEKLDPNIIDAILGKSDAQLMMEAMQVIKNPQASDDEKELAWEDFEMLIQQIDNASNIDNMKMWPPLLEELKNPNPKFREQALWSCGTATQNNPKAQAAFLREKGLSQVLEMLTSDPEKFVRAKAIYAVSGAVKHCDAAQLEFNNLGGYKILVKILEDETDISLLRKTIFFIGVLLLQDETASTQLLDQHFFHAVDRLLKHHMDDEDLIEKTLVTLKTFFETATSPIHPQTLHMIRPRILEAKKAYGDHMLAKADWDVLETKTA